MTEQEKEVLYKISSYIDTNLMPRARFAHYDEKEYDKLDTISRMLMELRDGSSESLTNVEQEAEDKLSDTY